PANNSWLASRSRWPAPCYSQRRPDREAQQTVCATHSRGSIQTARFSLWRRSTRWPARPPADIVQIVHTFREGRSVNGGPTGPPGLASLGTLVAHYSHTGLEVTVRTTGNPRPLATVTNPAKDGGKPRSAGSHGLIAMRERAVLIGGTLEARGGQRRLLRLCQIPYGGRPA